MNTPSQEKFPFQKNNLARLSALLTCLAVVSILLVLLISFTVGMGHSNLMILAFAPPMFAVFGFISGGLTLFFETGRSGRYLFYALSALVVCGGIIFMYWPV